MRFFIILLTFLLSISQAFAYELSSNDKNLLNQVMPKFYAIIDRGERDTAWIILERIEELEEKQQTERILEILDFIYRDIETKYSVGKYIVTTSATPVLGSPDFKAQFGWTDGVTLNFDRFWEIDAVEFIAFENTVFELKNTLGNNIYEVATADYPVENALYIHKNFVWDISRVEPDARLRILPSKEKILENLISMQWSDYVWGGNDPKGIPQILEIYPPAAEINALKSQQWQLEWVDCSGLIYAATDGYTPRNTSWLVNYWEALDIADKNLDQIIPMLEPLDIIVWRGHMLVVYSETETIESAVSFTDSKLKPWVQIRDIQDSLWEIMQSRVPVNNYYASSHSRPFVIVRWYK